MVQTKMLFAKTCSDQLKIRLSVNYPQHKLSIVPEPMKPDVNLSSSFSHISITMKYQLES